MNENSELALKPFTYQAHPDLINKDEEIVKSPSFDAALVINLDTDSKYELVESQSIETEQVGRLRKIGRFVTSLPTKINEKLLRSYVNFQSDPKNFAKRTAEGSFIFFEASPLSGVVRYGGATAVYAATKDPLASAAFLSASTAAIEAPAMVVMSNIIDRKDSKTLETANNAIDKFIPREKKVGILAQSVLVNYIGVPLMLAAKNREVPERTRRENIQHGAKATGLLSLAIGAQGYLAFKGVENITEPKVVVPAVATLGALGYAVGKAKNRIKKQN